MDLRIGWLQIPMNRQLSKLSKGELFVLNYLDTQGEKTFPKELSIKMQVSAARVAALLKHMDERMDFASS